MSKPIAPCLWLDTEAQDAAKFYCSVFPNSKITATSYYGEAGPRPKGSVLTVGFELNGQPFTALNGGPQFKFSEAVSFQIYCDSQDEVDHYWNGLLAGGGTEDMCGWLKDRYGLSWQVVPNRLIELITSPDEAKTRRVTEAMFKMRKLDIAALEAAAK
ncbi:MAG: VOC family protein [Alphaproteobacteria bacterium]|nr:VOC family protein [Alphaproteobacteria bacterium]